MRRWSVGIVSIVIVGILIGNAVGVGWTTVDAVGGVFVDAVGVNDGIGNC